MRGLGLGLGLSRRQTAEIGPTLSPLSLSAATIEEGAAAGTTVGTILGATSGSTVTLQAQSNANWFAKDGDDIEAGASATDYETASAPTITLRETNAGATNSPRDTVIAITVTNVLEVTLGALNLDDLTHAPDAVQGTKVGGITGTTAGSTVTLHAQEVANAYQKDGSDIELGSAAPLSAGERDITLRETHPDASNSPRDTVITITSEVALGNELFAQPGFDATTGLTLNSWTVGSSQANSNASNSFMICTAAETLGAGTYRIVLDVATASGGTVETLVIVGGVTKSINATSSTVFSVDLVVASVSEQLIRVRDSDEGGLVLNGLSVKKHQ